MLISNSFFLTRKEYPNDEEDISTKLLMKSGMIYKNSTGVFSYYPMGLRVLNNIKEIIRKEMNKINSEEVLMPSLVKSSVFESTNRKELFKSEMFNLKDRNDNNYSLCPTHEELFSVLVRNEIQSYKDLHFTLYQISNKYRDEIKVKNGLSRKKEFMMMDAYSFDADGSGLDISYDKIYQTFNNILKKLCLNSFICLSQDSKMKDTFSEEFHIKCDYGEERVVKCKKCSFVSNINYADSYDTYQKTPVLIKKKKEVYTPNVKSVKDLASALDISLKDIIKALIYKVNDEYVMVLLRADAEVNEKKLCKVLNTNEIILPSVSELERMGTNVGYIGPIKTTMRIVADNEVKGMYNAICGSNKANYHYINVNPGIDFKVSKYASIKLFNEESLCPRCKSKADIFNSMELAHIFKLDANYSETASLRYLNEINKLEYVTMGSYGIGIDRCMSAIVYDHHDEKGIVWPINVAPYKVAIVVSNVNEKEAFKYAKTLHDKLNELNIDTILDDRKETLGVKLNDIELIGIPMIITIGYNYFSDMVELKLRNTNETILIHKDKVVNEITNIIKNNNK